VSRDRTRRRLADGQLRLEQRVGDLRDRSEGGVALIGRGGSDASSPSHARVKEAFRICCCVFDAASAVVSFTVRTHRELRCHHSRRWLPAHSRRARERSPPAVLAIRSSLAGGRAAAGEKSAWPTDATQRVRDRCTRHQFDSRA
jgi:hypothetical protein